LSNKSYITTDNEYENKIVPITDNLLAANIDSTSYFSAIETIAQEEVHPLGHPNEREIHKSKFAILRDICRKDRIEGVTWRNDYDEDYSTTLLKEVLKRQELILQYLTVANPSGPVNYDDVGNSAPSVLKNRGK